MAEVRDLPYWVQAMLAAYRWRRIDPTPRATLRVPLERARVALVTTAGLVAPGQPPFDESSPGGDWSYRVIPGDLDPERLEEHQRSESFDHAGIASDRNLALPLNRLRELVADGTIGEVAPRHLSFMGSITAPGRLMRRSAPEAAGLLVEDQVDLALVIPV